MKNADQPSHIQPQGEHGSEPLPFIHERAWIRSTGYAHGAGAYFDWYNDRLQILVDDGTTEDPAIHVRLNPNGTIAEIIVRHDLMPVVRREDCREKSQWQDERDHREEPATISN